MLDKILIVKENGLFYHYRNIDTNPNAIPFFISKFEYSIIEDVFYIVQIDGNSEMDFKCPISNVSTQDFGIGLPVNGYNTHSLTQFLDAWKYPYDIVHQEVSVSDSFKRGDILEVNPTEIQYFSINTGLGFAKRLGWALCDGRNGTNPKKKRRVAIGYDPSTYLSGINYSVLGGEMGEEKHKLIKEELPIFNVQIPTSSDQSGFGKAAVGSSNDEGPLFSLPIGGDQPHENMQPSYVGLFIEKITDGGMLPEPSNAVIKLPYNPIDTPIGDVGVIYIEYSTGFQYIWKVDAYIVLGEANANSSGGILHINCLIGQQTYTLPNGGLAKLVLLNGIALYESNNDYTTTAGILTILTTNFPTLQTGDKLIIFL